MAITSFEEFKKKAFKEVELPGFEPGETVTVRLRKVSILSLASSGKIPNSLMGVVNKLFNSSKEVDEEAVKETSMEHLAEMSKLLDLVASCALVEPTFDQIGEYLTDEQKNAIFEYSQGEVKQVTPIVSE